MIMGSSVIIATVVIHCYTVVMFVILMSSTSVTLIPSTSHTAVLHASPRILTKARQIVGKKVQLRRRPAAGVHGI